MVTEGINLAIFGMGTVFVFLILLIGVTHSMSTLVHRFLPESRFPALPANPETEGGSAGAEEGELLAVITVAIQRFRSR